MFGEFIKTVNAVESLQYALQQMDRIRRDVKVRLLDQEMLKISFDNIFKQVKEIADEDLTKLKLLMIKMSNAMEKHLLEQDIQKCEQFLKIIANQTQCEDLLQMFDYYQKTKRK